MAKQIYNGISEAKMYVCLLGNFGISEYLLELLTSNILHCFQEVTYNYTRIMVGGGQFHPQNFSGKPIIPSRIKK